MNLDFTKNNPIEPILDVINRFIQFEVQEVKIQFGTVKSYQGIEFAKSQLKQFFNETQSALESHGACKMNPFSHKVFDLWINGLDYEKIQEAENMMNGDTFNHFVFTATLSRDNLEHGPFYKLTIDFNAVLKPSKFPTDVVIYPIAELMTVLSYQKIIVKAST